MSAFIESHPETQARFDRVVKLIHGFETPFGMELLATVHRVSAGEGARSEVEATRHRAPQALLKCRLSLAKPDVPAGTMERPNRPGLRSADNVRAHDRTRLFRHQRLDQVFDVEPRHSQRQQ